MNSPTLLGIGKSRNFSRTPGFDLLEEGPVTWSVPEDFWCSECESAGCKKCKWQGQVYKFIYQCICKVCSREFDVRSFRLAGKLVPLIQKDGSIRFSYHCPDHQTKRGQKESKNIGEVFLLHD